MEQKEEENMEDLDFKSSQMIITKFLRKGFEGLALEDLAVALIVPNFYENFQKMTGVNWTNKYEVKALERLSHASFDLHWMTRKTQNSYDFLFINCLKGDVEKVREFMKKVADENLLFAVDERKRSPLHLAAKAGHTSLVEILLLKGFNVAARDRILKTPLHYAAQLGHDTVASILMKNGSPLEAKDNCGRTPFLYACLGSSSQMITLFLATKPECIFDVDNIGRKALHYAVYNNSAKQIDIIRCLLQKGCKVNDTDDEGFTCLHLASEGGRTRAIPILLKNGANLGIREKKTQKTALDLAANDRTREILIVYGTVSYKPNEEEKEWMNTAIKGEKLPITKLNEKKPPPTQEKKVGREEESSNAMITFLREQFFELMKKIQDTGVQNFQHFKRPYLYTGSWMEGIRTIEDLYDRIKDLRPAEAAIRTFNILCPYDKPLPVLKGDEKAIVNMFGDPWFDITESPSSFKKTVVQNDGEIREKALQASLERNREALEDKNQIIEKLNEEINSIKLECEELKKNIAEKNNFVKNSAKLKEENESKTQEINQLNTENKRLNRKIKELEMIIETRQSDNASNNEELTQLNDKIAILEEKLSRAKAFEKSNRFKAGKIFIKALDELKSQRVLPSNLKDIKAQGGLENLEDDDAIIRLYQALKKSPPGLMQRLRAEDANGDNELTQNEFTSFCEKLKLAGQDIHSLCRVAGFFDGKQRVGIEEFKKILEERPKMREQWEKYLFKRVIRAFKEKNLTVDQLFNLIDVDDDKKVSPAELKMGLESLKIVLNQRDFNNMFMIFDKDKNKTIDLDEMKNILLFYENKPDIDNDAAEEWENRIKDKNLDDFEENKYDKLKASDNLSIINKNMLETENINVNDDVTLLNGDLKIQIPYGHNLLNEDKIKELIIRIRIKGSIEPDIHKSMLLLDKNKWEFAIKMPIRSSLRENLSDTLNIQLFSSLNFDEKTFLGELALLWKTCIDKPENWVVNNEFPLKNISFSDKEPVKNVTGLLGVQVRYIPSTSKDFKSKLFENDSVAQTKKNFISSALEQGMLQATLISCVLKDKYDIIKCRIKLPDKSAETLEAKFDEDKNPFWNEIFTQELSLQSQTNVDCINVKIFSEKSKGLVGTTEIVLGEIYIDWQECIQYPLQFLSHKAFLFPLKTSGNEKPNKLYMKIRWIPKSQYSKLTGFSANLDDKSKKKKIMDNPADYLYGTLKVLVVRASGLGKNSNIDPYCILKIETEKTLQVQTKEKTQIQDPEFLEKFVFDVKFLKDGPKPPLHVILKDKNLGKDTHLGQTAVKLTPALNDPYKWAIDDYFPLKGEKGEELAGKVYIQVYFVPKGGLPDPNIKPIDKENKASLAEEDEIRGKLIVRVVHAKELKAADGQTSDPFCTINLPDSTSLKTSTINKTINPIWNEKFEKEIKIAREKMAPIKFVLKDDDFLKDDLLGMVEVDWKVCIEKHGLWAINEILKISGTPDIMGKLSSLGYLYVQVKFLEVGEKDDEKLPPCIENLAEIMAQKAGVWKGTLRVFLISGKNLLKMDKDSSDPKVIFKVSGGKQIESSVIKNSLDPVWKKIYNIPVNMARNTLQPMRVEVYDDDLVGKDFMGYTNVILEECFKNPGKWAINKVYELDGNAEQKKKNIREYGSLYIQVMYVIEGENLDIPTLPMVEDLDEISRKKMEREQQLIQGILKLNIVMAKGLRIADASKGGLSDPYCVATFPDNKNISTKILENELNPIWNFSHPQQISIKYLDYKPILIKLYDKDAGLSDDQLGEVSIDWMECVNNPGLWMVNDLFTLQGDKTFGRDLGDIYVQMKFVNNIKEEDNDICPTKKELIEEYGHIMGKFNIDIFSAAGLYNSDTFGKSDPYCVAYLSLHPNENLKTQVIQDSLDPVWNYKGNFLFLDVRRKQIKGLKLYVFIYDEDTVKPEVLGTVELSLIPFLQTPHQPLAKDYPIVRKGKPNGSLKLGVEWAPDPRCETLENIENMENLLTGELIVRVINGRQLKDIGLLSKLSPFVQLLSSLDYKKTNAKRTKALPNNLNPDWNEVLSLAVNKVPYDDLKAANLIVKVLDGDRKAVVGGVEISLYPVIEKPGTWLNDYFAIMNEKGDKNVGWVCLQIQFKAAGNANESPIPNPLDFAEIQKKLDELKAKVIEGQLLVNVLGAKKLKAGDFGGKSDPFCALQLSDPKIKKILRTETIDKTLDPMWDSRNHIFDVSLLQEELDALALYIKVYDYDRISDDLLGQYQVDLKTELFSKAAGEWFNGFFPLLNEKNEPEGAQEIYIQMQWRPKDFNDINLDPPENLLAKEIAEFKQKEEKRKQELANIPKKTGRFLINIVSAINLKKADLIGNSDPYCVLALSKGEKQKVSTKPIDNTLNPLWNLDNQSLAISLPQPEYDELKLFINVYDYDTELTSDLLGSAVLDLLPLVHEPGTWFNDFIVLMDEKGNTGKNGSINLQIQWLEQGMEDKVLPAPEKLKAPREKPKEPTIKGELFIKIVGAKGLKSEDIGGKSDPYCTVALSQGKGNRTIKTKIIENDLNPLWNHEDLLKLDYSLSEYKIIKMIGEVFDNDYNGDDFLGKLILDIGFLFESPGQWFNKSFSLMNKENKAATQGELYIMAQWRPEGQNVDMTLPKSLYEISNEPINKNLVKNTKENKIEENKKEENKVESIKEPPKEPGLVTGVLLVKIVQANKLPSMDFIGKSDPFCKFIVEKANPQLVETKVIDDNNDPVWNHEDKMKIALQEKEILTLIGKLDVIDSDYGKTNLIGSAEIEIGKIAISNPNKPVRQEISLINSKKKPVKNSVVIMEFTWTAN